MNILKWLFSIFKCPFANPKCGKFGCKCGKSGKSSAPPAPAPVQDPTALANAQVQAQLAAIPKAAELQYNVLADPNYGLQAQTALQEQTRRNVFGKEANIQDQLAQVVLNNLLSPTGITPEQQAALDARRSTAQNELVQALRERSNLGGGLYGGRSANAEARNVAELQQSFAAEDIQRQEQARLNAQQAALSYLQSFYPGAQLVNPQFINPVASPEANLQGQLTQRGQDINYQIAQQQAQAQLQSALYGALGEAAGSLGGSFFKPIGAAANPGTATNVRAIQ